jgi:hypothetical protein
MTREHTLAGLATTEVILVILYNLILITSVQAVGAIVNPISSFDAGREGHEHVHSDGRLD